MVAVLAIMIYTLTVVSIRGVKTILCNIYKSEDVILNRVDGWSFSSVLDFSTYDFFSYQTVTTLWLL